MGTEGFAASLEPAEGSIDFIRDLRKLANVYVVTSPNHSRHWVYDRTEWLRDHFGFDPKHVVHTHAKALCVGDFFLDDSPDHVMRWRAKHPGKDGMWWSTLHNRRLVIGDPSLRVHSWDEVLKRVRDSK